MLIQLPNGTWYDAAGVKEIVAYGMPPGPGGPGVAVVEIRKDRKLYRLPLYATLAEAERARDELAAKVNAAMKGE